MPTSWADEYDRLCHPDRGGPVDQASVASARNHQPRSSSTAGRSPATRVLRRSRLWGILPSRAPSDGTGCDLERPRSRLSTATAVASLPTVPMSTPSGSRVDTYQIDAVSDGRLLVRVHPDGILSSLLLRDAQGRLLIESDGISSRDLDNEIALHVPAGSYTLQVESSGGSGHYALTTSLTTTSTASQPFAQGDVGPLSLVVGDFTGDPGRRHRRSRWPACGCRGCDVSRSPGRHTRQSHGPVRARTGPPSWPVLISMATGTSTWRRSRSE